MHESRCVDVDEKKVRVSSLSASVPAAVLWVQHCASCSTVAAAVLWKLKLWVRRALAWQISPAAGAESVYACWIYQ